MSEGNGKRGCVRWWLLLILFVGLPAAGWVLAAVMTYSTMPRLYESRAVVEVVPLEGDCQLGGVDVFMETEVGIMSSGEVFRGVVEKIRLDARWGVTQQDAMEELHRIIRVRRRGESRLVEVRVRHRKREEAQVVASAVYESYCDRKGGLWRGLRKDKLKAIKIELQNKSDWVSELRKRYADVRGKVMSGTGKEYDAQIAYDAGRERAAEEMSVAKKELDLADGALWKMQAAYNDGRDALGVPVTPIIVHEVPGIATDAISPNVSRSKARGAIFGFIAACAVAGLLVFVSVLRRILGTKNPAG